jgi:hypothetical protein
MARRSHPCEKNPKEKKECETKKKEKKERNVKRKKVETPWKVE